MKLIPVKTITNVPLPQGTPPRTIEKVYWINPEYIVRMTTKNGGQEGSMLWLVDDDDGTHVKETVEEIKTLIVN